MYIYQRNSAVNSLVWGSLTLTPINWWVGERGPENKAGIHYPCPPSFFHNSASLGSNFCDIRKHTSNNR